MLNIGRLSPGAAEYYVGEVATYAEDYYVGHGEAPGRWIGSLAPRLGLQGQVNPEDFRRILEGRHPFTGEWLLSARGSAGRAAQRRRCRAVQPGQPALFDSEGLDVARVAARLNISSRHVRRLLDAGAKQADPGRSDSRRPNSFLVGQRIRTGHHGGPTQWRVPESEVERFEAQRKLTKARPGYDLTLRPPKSVSVLWALGDADQQTVIRQAHRQSVDAVVDYYESQAIFARRGSRGRARIMTEGLVAAAFDHRTSRAGDPLLHTHVVTANLTYTVKGRWQAMDGKPIYEHARSAGYLYQAHLRNALTRDAGLAWDPVDNGWAEVSGVPKSVIRAFSKRRDEIEELIAESGNTSARAHDAATLASRKAKDYSVKPETLLERWRGEAETLGFGTDAVNACFGRTTVTEHQPQVVERLLDRLAGPDGLTERASTFRRRDVVEALATALNSTANATEITSLADSFLASPRVVPLSRAGGGRNSDTVIGADGNPVRTSGTVSYSTPELLAVEAQVLDWANDGFGKAVPQANADAIEAAINDRPELSDEQVDMVRAVCTSTAAIQPISGRPGAGKTYATDACVQALLASGIPVTGCAVSATAAAELEAATSLGPVTGRPATTIARLLIELDDPMAGGFARDTVLVVDEASMVGTRDIARLAGHLVRAGGAMKLIGDPHQHGPVEAGGIFRHLVTHRPDILVKLVENNRQTDEAERIGIDEYRQGRIGEALARYDAAGNVIRTRTAGASYDAMVADWYTHWREGSTDPMVAGPNSTRRALNARARVLLKAEGALNGPALVTGGREFMVGDWIVTRKNNRKLHGADPHLFVKNGSTGTVVDVNVDAGDLVVDFTNEGRVRLPRPYVDAGWVEHGYARTSYGVQGATFDHGFYSASDDSSFEEGYVSLTRGRHRTKIYVVDGVTDPDRDLAHDGHDIEVTGLETVAEALEQRHGNPLAHEMDARAAASSSVFAGYSRQALRLERERIERTLAETPQSFATTLDAACRHRDSLLAKVRLPTRNDVLDARLNAINAQITQLQRLEDARSEFLGDHKVEVSRLRLVRDAEVARDLQDRTRTGILSSPCNGCSTSSSALGRTVGISGRQPRSQPTLPGLKDPAPDVEPIIPG